MEKEKMPPFLMNIDWIMAFTNLGHMLVAFVLAIPIGLDREHSKKNFGIRTYPLVAVVSCL